MSVPRRERLIFWQTGGFTKKQLIGEKGIASTNNEAGNINVYFVKSFDTSLDDILGFTYPGPGGTTIFIADSTGGVEADARTIAHELGHVLTLPDIRDDASNLMFAAERVDGIGSGTDLTLKQVNDARTHAE